jgi:hypothetical protein
MIILIWILGRFVVKIEGSWHGFKIVSRGSSEFLASVVTVWAWGSVVVKVLRY